LRIPLPAPHTFDRPFPALTPAQRYSFEIHGYVVVPGVLQADEIASLREALYRLRGEILALEERGAEGPRVRGAYLIADRPHHHFMTNLLQAHPLLTAYATHPRLVGMAEEILGGEGRLVEINSLINRRPADPPLDPHPTYPFHRGTDIPFGSHVRGGLYHCSFVKALTYLTEVGPQDGGTVVIAGSHKVDLPLDQLIGVAYQDRSLIHQIQAPAGSTLLFAETLIHATGQIRSDRERIILVSGYAPVFFPYWDNGTLSPAFAQSIPPQLRPLFQGRATWKRGPRYRQLTDPADDRTFTLGVWDQRSPAPDPENKP